MKLINSTKLLTDPYYVFLSNNFIYLVLDYIQIQTGILISVNYHLLTVSGWITRWITKYGNKYCPLGLGDMSFFLFLLTGLFALSINHSNSYLAYPGSATNGEIIVYDANNLVRINFNYVQTVIIINPSLYIVFFMCIYDFNSRTQWQWLLLMTAPLQH